MMAFFCPSLERTSVAPTRLPIFSLPYHLLPGVHVSFYMFLGLMRNWKVACFAGRREYILEFKFFNPFVIPFSYFAQSTF
jgi:hypothetical protein